MSDKNLDEDAIAFAKSAVDFDKKKEYGLAISYYLVNLVVL